MSSSAAGCAAVLAYEAPLLIYEGFLSAVGTFHKGVAVVALCHIIYSVIAIGAYS